MSKKPHKKIKIMAEKLQGFTVFILQSLNYSRFYFVEKD